jgi:hypothetical protein
MSEKNDMILPSALSDQLKNMLEGGEAAPTPIAEFDPASLDELVHRIDSGFLRLSQVPPPEMIAELVAMNRILRTQFNFDFESNPKPRKRRDRLTDAEGKQALKDSEAEW